MTDSRLIQYLSDRINSHLTPTHSPAKGSKGRLAQAIMSGVLPPLMLMVIWWNIETTWTYREHPVPEPPRWVQDTMRYTGLWQYWDLFAPVPYMIDGRLVVEGRFENGAGYNLYTETPLTVETPPVQFGPDLRWLKLEENVFNDAEAPLMTAWSEYYCSLYNVEKHAIRGTRLKTLQFHYIYRYSHAPGEPVNEITDEVLWDYDCIEP